MDNIYNDGSYLKANKSWGIEDSSWKANQIIKIIKKNDINPKNIVEVGCGGGRILDSLSKKKYLQNVQFKGYDISNTAINLCNNIDNNKLKFYCKDLMSIENSNQSDLLLVIDVIEHVPDYISFANKCRTKAKYKIFHIPLDIHCSSVLRNSFLNQRYTLGHLHYFSAESAIALLKDTDHQIIDYFYTNVSFVNFKFYKSPKTTIANIPRWAFSKISKSLSARIFGGYSLLVLTK